LVTKARVLTLLAYAACVAIWSTTWLAIKFSLHGLPPLVGAGARFILAGLVLYALGAALRVNFRRAAPPLRLVAVLAIAMFGLNYALTYFAESHLASGLVAVLFGTTPFFIFALARLMLGERAGPYTIGGALLAFAGVAVISLVGNVRGDALYILAVLGAAASTAYATVYLKRHAIAEPFATLPPAMLAAGLVLGALGLVFEPVDWRAAAQPGALAALAYLAVFGSALAFYFNHWLLQRIDSGTMGLSALMIPVFAVVVGALFGGEVFGPRDIAGALLVVGGVWLSLARGRPIPQVAREVEPHLIA
jgi:drug/metabolite transporter (DMT)-like permease